MTIISSDALGLVNRSPDAWERLCEGGHMSSGKGPPTLTQFLLREVFRGACFAWGEAGGDGAGEGEVLLDDVVGLEGA